MQDALDRLPAALHAVAPTVDAAVWLAALTPPMRASGLVTPRRAAMFLGQCSEESGGFTALAENCNYSANRMCQVWPSRFATVLAAAPFARNAEKLANHVYSSRLGNGDEASGDGFRFRGGGLIQLTGRDAYQRFATSVGMALDDAAAWVRTPPGAVASACWYWIDRGKLLGMSDNWDIDGVTQRINGGLTNLDVRRTRCDAAFRAFFV